MSSAIQKRAARCKRRIQRRRRRRNWPAPAAPMLRGGNSHYEGSDRVRGLGAGGIGAMHRLAQQTGLRAAIDESLQVLKVHQPYHESDHVLNIAYNILCGGKTLEDLEQRRQDEVYLDALGARVIPDPTTAGDITRRLQGSDIEALMAAILGGCCCAGTATSPARRDRLIEPLRRPLEQLKNGVHALRMPVGTSAGVHRAAVSNPPRRAKNRVSTASILSTVRFPASPRRW